MFGRYSIFKNNIVGFSFGVDVLYGTGKHFANIFLCAAQYEMVLQQYL